MSTSPVTSVSKSKIGLNKNKLKSKFAILMDSNLAFEEDKKDEMSSQSSVETKE